MNPRLVLDRKALGEAVRIGRGGQGTVFTAPRVRLNLVGEAVFKEYHPDIRARLDVGALESMVAFLDSLTFEEGSMLIGWTAWPVRLVAGGGATVGFVMPRIPAEFALTLRKSSGKTEQVRSEFQHLLNPEPFLANRGIPIHDRLRYQLLADLARALDFLHGKGIAVGDLSPKNVLFSLAPHARVYFIDCDSMVLSGTSALVQVETPGWEVGAVSREPLGTPATDRYKLGLLALRLFARDQDTRDPGNLPRDVPDSVRRLVEASLAVTPEARPAAAEWVAPLQAAADRASTALPVRDKSWATTPALRPATPREATGRRRQPAPGWAAAAGSGGGSGAGAVVGMPRLSQQRIYAVTFAAVFLTVLGVGLYATRSEPDAWPTGGTEPHLAEPLDEAAPSPSSAQPGGASGPSAEATRGRAASGESGADAGIRTRSPGAGLALSLSGVADTVGTLRRAAEAVLHGDSPDAYVAAARLYREALSLIGDAQRRAGPVPELESLRDAVAEDLSAAILACETELRTAPAIGLRPEDCPTP